MLQLFSILKKRLYFIFVDRVKFPIQKVYFECNWKMKRFPFRSTNSKKYYWGFVKKYNTFKIDKCASFPFGIYQWIEDSKNGLSIEVVVMKQKLQRRNKKNSPFSKNSKKNQDWSSIFMTFSVFLKIKSYWISKIWKICNLYFEKLHWKLHWPSIRQSF